MLQIKHQPLLLSLWLPALPVPSQTQLIAKDEASVSCAQHVEMLRPAHTHTQTHSSVYTTPVLSYKLDTLEERFKTHTSDGLRVCVCVCVYTCEHVTAVWPYVVVWMTLNGNTLVLSSLI